MGPKSSSRKNAMEAGSGTEKTAFAPTTTRRPRWLYLALLLLSIAPFVRAFSYGSIHLDDAEYITDHALIQSGLSLSAIWDATFGFHHTNWHPLVWISYMTEIQLFGMNLKAMHATNIFLHSANSLLLFRWLFGVTSDWKRSFLATSVYAVHPQHVESVVWLSERKDVLSTFFLMLTLLTYTRYVRQPGWLNYFAALVAFAFGLSAKGMLVTLPLLLVFLDFWPYHRLVLPLTWNNRAQFQRLLLDKIPFVGLSLCTAVLTVMAQQRAITGLHGHSVSERFANAVVSLVRYLHGYFVPTTFSVSYPFPKDGWSSERIVFSLLLIIAMTFLTLRLRRTKPAVLVGWLWFTVSLLPVIGLVQVGAQAMADRYMYVPTIGLSLMVSWLIPDAWISQSEGTDQSAKARERVKFWFTTGVVVAVTMLALRTDQVVSKWKDSITLFSHAATVEPDNNYLAHRALGAAYFDAGKLDASAEHYALALKCLPERKEAVTGSVNEWLAAGNVAKAGVYTKAALQLDENDGDLWFLMGNVMRKQGRSGDAEHCYRKAISLKPRFSEALHNLGLILSSTNNADGILYYRKALEADPANAVAWNSLGNAMVRAGDLQSAEQAYLEAIRLADLVEAKNNLQYVRESRERSTPGN